MSNWYFADPVNQRGQTKYTSNNPDVISIDGWHIGWFTTMTLEDDGIKLSAKADRTFSTLRMITVIQIPTELVGKTLHASILYSTTSTVKFGLYNRENILPTSEQKTLYECEIIPTSTQLDFMAIRSEEQNANAKVYAVKLESGNHQTLAYQDSNGDWVLNDPMPNKLESALKCGPLGNSEQQVFYGNGKWANVPSNPNLLDNPDFRINQRGKTSYDANPDTGNIYGLDRWVNGKYSIDDTGIVLENRGMYYVLEQRLESQVWSSHVADNDVTFSASMNGSVYAVTSHVPNGNCEYDAELALGMKIRFYHNADRYCVCLWGDSGVDAVHVEWVKLEQGVVATAFVSPNSASELLKCQRYYQTVGVGYTLQIRDMATSIVCCGKYPVEMRAIPTVSILKPKAEISGLFYGLVTDTDISIKAQSITKTGITFIWFTYDCLHQDTREVITERTSLNGFYDDAVFGLSADL